MLFMYTRGPDTSYTKKRNSVNIKYFLDCVMARKKKNNWGNIKANSLFLLLMDTTNSRILLSLLLLAGFTSYL